jgi:SAM-dependent methyltransferase
MDPSFYEEYAEIEHRHWWFVGRSRVLLALLDEVLPPPPADRPREVLDLGCGTGAMTKLLSRYGRAIGVDVEATAVAAARKRGVNAQQIPTAGPLPLPSDQFDVVTSLDVIEHIDDDVAVLSEMYRVMKPGGTLLIAVPAFEWLWGPQDEISHHKRRYVATQLRRHIREAGFEVERTSYFNTLLFAPIAAIRVLRPTRPGQPVKSDCQMTRLGGPADRLLAWIFGLEARLVPRVRLPVGVSLLAVARKQG